MMQIHTQRHGSATVLKPEGALTQAQANRLKQYVDDALARRPKRLLIDAAAISAVDSRGLEVLVEASEKVAEGGQTLGLCGVDESLREVLELTGLSPLFKQYSDVAEAVKGY